MATMRRHFARRLALTWCAALVLGLTTPRSHAVLAADDPPAWFATAKVRISEHPGQAAVVIKHLPSGECFEHRSDVPMPTASLIKFPVMIEAYRQAEAGKLNLTQLVALKDEDKVPGSGILTSHFSQGAAFPVRDLIRMMIAWSDNTATNLVVDQIGLPATRAAMGELKCPNTQLHSKVFRRDTSIDPDRSREFGLGSTTAAEMIRLLEQLHAKQLVSAAASEQMLTHLYACQDKDTFPRGLPSGLRVAHKTGLVTGVRTDAGLVEFPGGTLLFCILTKENRRAAGQTIDPGEQLCGDLARLAFAHYHRPGVAANGQSPRLELGASGEAVRQLQTALNQTLDPAPGLDVDGEFGPVTQAAVVRLQRDKKLPTTGIVDEATWKALGVGKR